jgi:hypothetical protein
VERLARQISTEIIEGGRILDDGRAGAMRVGHQQPPLYGPAIVEPERVVARIGELCIEV